MATLADLPLIKGAARLLDLASPLLIGRTPQAHQEAAYRAMQAAWRPLATNLRAAMDQERPAVEAAVIRRLAQEQRGGEKPLAPVRRTGLASSNLGDRST